MPTEEKPLVSHHKFWITGCFLLFVSLYPNVVFALTADEYKSTLYRTEYSALGNFTGDCVSGSTNLVGSSNIQKAYNYFLAKGLKDFQSAGIVGNMIRESGVVPDRVEVKFRGDGPTNAPAPIRGKGYGIVQWTSQGRQEGLERFADRLGRPVSDLGLQLDFVWEEMPSQRDSLDAIKATTTVEEATAVFEDRYERAGVVALSQRIGFAREVLELYGGGAPPSELGGCSAEVPSGTAQELAQKLLDSKNITSYGTYVKQDLEKTAQGEAGSAGKPLDEKLLQLLVSMAGRFSFHITALQSGGRGHTASSNHYEGKAADLVPSGSTSYDQMNAFIYENRTTFAIDELIFYPMPAGVPTLRRGEPFTYSAGVLYGSDGRNGDDGHEDHTHVSVK